MPRIDYEGANAIDACLQLDGYNRRIKIKDPIWTWRYQVP
jgi:hypothetical protein